MSDGTREDLTLYGDFSRHGARIAALVYPRALDIHRVDLLDHRGHALSDERKGSRGRVMTASMQAWETLGCVAHPGGTLVAGPLLSVGVVQAVSRASGLQLELVAADRSTTAPRPGAGPTSGTGPG